MQALQIPQCFLLNPHLNYCYKTQHQIVLRGMSCLHPPLCGKAIKLFFSTLPKILSASFNLAVVHRGQIFSINSCHPINGSRRGSLGFLLFCQLLGFEKYHICLVTLSQCHKISVTQGYKMISQGYKIILLIQSKDTSLTHTLSKIIYICKTLGTYCFLICHSPQYSLLSYTESVSSGWLLSAFKATILKCEHLIKALGSTDWK